MRGTLSLGYSPCPNDTFIFYGLVHGLIESEGLTFIEQLMDVETLNQAALRAELDVTKVSYGAYPGFRRDYALLRSGGALGRGCGPLVVARDACALEDLKGKRIAIPGLNTTAYLLLRLCSPSLADNVLVMSFDKIMPAVVSGQADAGLIIHEGRFTYPAYGLSEVIDLGAWWEDTTGRPIPLGGIIIRRALGAGAARTVERLVRQSVEYAFAHPDAPVDYIKAHSQELSDDVIRKHIALYVNEFSLDLGGEGTDAVDTLYRMAQERGIVPVSSEPLFIS